MRERNYYEVLGFSKEDYKIITKKDIKNAYKKLSQRTHPDKNGGSKESIEAFKELCNAYEVLYDDEKRKNYDENDFKDAFTEDESVTANIVLKAFLSLLQANDFSQNLDYVSSIETIINRSIQIEKNSIEKQKTQFAKVERVEGKFKTNSDRNVFDDFLKNEKNYIELNIENSEEKIIKLEKAKKFLSDYSFEGIIAIGNKVEVSTTINGNIYLPTGV